MIRKKISIFFVILTIFFNLLPISTVFAYDIESVPTVVLNIDNSDKQYPIIYGQTLVGTEVLIYDNMEFKAIAKEVLRKDGKIEFSYQPTIALSDGQHIFTALTRDKTSLRLSVFSNEVDVKVITKNPNTLLSVPAPTLIEPNEKTVTAKVMPLIKGLTVNNTKVNFYIDGVLNGGTAFLNHESGTANFAYKPFLNLRVGCHVAWAVAVDKRGRVSQLSNILSFKIEEQLPAPILKQVINKEDNKIVLTGLVKNNLQVRIFVDHKLNQEIKVLAHPSGTANFAYHLGVTLTAGTHIIYTTAVDSRGKESKWSNIVYHVVGEALSVSEVVASEATEEVEVLSMENKDFQKIKELLVLARLFDKNKEVQVDAQDIISLKDILNRKIDLGLSDNEVEALEKLLKESTVTKDEKVIDNHDIDKILNQDDKDNDEKTGIINESKENQSKLKLNLIIFIFFLVAVIVWIFWVNRELIKERREQNEGDEKIKKE